MTTTDTLTPDTDTDTDTATAWDRQPGEPSKCFAAFRTFRDLAPTSRRLEDVATQVGVTSRALRNWANDWDWWARADAWDDECYRVEDVERMEAIRTMHANHRRAGRAVLLKAMAALNLVEPGAIPVATAARLLELGAKLERQTLIVSVRDLQGIDSDDGNEDPWDRIARELDPAVVSA